MMAVHDNMLRPGTQYKLTKVDVNLRMTGYWQKGQTVTYKGKQWSVKFIFPEQGRLELELLPGEEDYKRGKKSLRKIIIAKGSVKKNRERLCGEPSMELNKAIINYINKQKGTFSQLSISHNLNLGLPNLKQPALKARIQSFLINGVRAGYLEKKTDMKQGIYHVVNEIPLSFKPTFKRDKPQFSAF